MTAHPHPVQKGVPPPHSGGLGATLPPGQTPGWGFCTSSEGIGGQAGRAGSRTLPGSLPAEVPSQLGQGSEKATPPAEQRLGDGLLPES